MSILILLVLGGGLGWIAGSILAVGKTGIDVMAGMFGALLGGWLLSPLFGGSVLSAERVSSGTLVEAAIGAVVLIALVQLVRKGMSMDESHRDRR